MEIMPFQGWQFWLCLHPLLPWHLPLDIFWGRFQRVNFQMNSKVRSQRRHIYTREQLDHHCFVYFTNVIKGYEFEPSTHCDDSIAWLEKHDDFDSAVEYCNTHSNCLCINYSKSGGCYTTKEGLKQTYNFGYDAWVILSISYY